jgi:hypothetical protein
MLKGKKKIVSNLGVGKTENRLLRLLRSEMGFQVSLNSVERTDNKNVYEQSRKEIDNALAEAEYQKARAAMTSQQVRTFC